MQNLNKSLFTQLFFPYLSFANQVRFCRLSNSNKEYSLFRYNDNNIQHRYSASSIALNQISELVFPLIRHIEIGGLWNCKSERFKSFFSKFVNLKEISIFEQNYCAVELPQICFSNYLKVLKMFNAKLTSIQLLNLHSFTNLIFCMFEFSFSDIIVGVNDVYSIINSLQVNSKHSLQVLLFQNIFLQNEQQLSSEGLGAIPEMLFKFSSLNRFEISFTRPLYLQTQQVDEKLLVCWKEAQLQFWPAVVIEYCFERARKTISFAKLYQKVNILRQETKFEQKRSEIIQSLKDSTKCIYLPFHFSEDERNSISFISEISHITCIKEDDPHDSTRIGQQRINPFSLIPEKCFALVESYTTYSVFGFHIQWLPEAIQQGKFPALNKLNTYRWLFDQESNKNLIFQTISSLNIFEFRLELLPLIINRIKSMFPNLKQLEIFEIDCEPPSIILNDNLFQFLKNIISVKIYISAAAREHLQAYRAIFASLSNVQIEAEENNALYITQPF